MSNPAKERLVILFAKFPAKGEVKTRLAAELGDEITVTLYKHFVTDLLATLDQVHAAIRICFYPQDAAEPFTQWLGSGYEFMPQQGDDLGERMKSAFARGFEEGYLKIIIIGSDSPDLPTTLINEAFGALQDSQAVIGPSLDGGYYLIGFRNDTFLPQVFKGIKWSSAHVFRDTMTIMMQTASELRLLPPWQDVDTLHDLKALWQRNQTTEFQSSHTISYLRSLKDNLPFGLEP